MRTFPMLPQMSGLNLRSEHAAVADPLAARADGETTDAATGGGAALFGADQFAFDSPDFGDGTVPEPWDLAAADPATAIVPDPAVDGLLATDDLFVFDSVGGISANGAIGVGSGVLSATWDLGGDTGFDSPSDAGDFAFASPMLDGFDFDRGGNDSGVPSWAPAADDLFAAGPNAADVAPAEAAAGDGSGGDAGITAIGVAFDAKGGVPGGPGGGGGNNGGGGGGGGGGGDTGVLSDYHSGSTDGDAGYDIWLDFKGSGWTVDLQSAFTNAADYFTTVITDDIGGGGRYHGKTIDDLYVTASLTSIDGTGGVLGQAGPSAVWTANDLTAAGQMEFDIADATDYLGRGLWDDIVTHEMMHVVGFGSLWDYGDHVGLVSNYQYTGQSALDAYRNDVDPTAAYIPVEQDGGSGTAGSHWDEVALNNELMTGYINDDGDPATNTDNYLSQFSVASLADLGYAVTYQDYPYDDPSAII